MAGGRQRTAIIVDDGLEPPVGSLGIVQAPIFVQAVIAACCCAFWASGPGRGIAVVDTTGRGMESATMRHTMSVNRSHPTFHDERTSPCAGHTPSTP
jgi:hypothetical protein